MITNKYWDILKQYWGNSFLFGDNKIEFQNYKYDYDYMLNLKRIITNFEKEVEQNFLSIPNNETRDNYIVVLYDEINKRIRLNGEYAQYIIRYEKTFSEEINNLLSRQNDALFGLTLWFKMNPLFEKTLQGESMVSREIKMDNSNHDNRIKGKLSKQEIEKYFITAFSEKQKDLNPILDEEQINNFLYSNFADFVPAKVAIKFQTVNITQKKIRAIIYDFYLKHSNETKTDIYITLLKNSFSNFDNTSFETLRKNFSKKR
jgi:hypothetical protein